jgi:hypothetical protein
VHNFITGTLEPTDEWYAIAKEQVKACEAIRNNLGRIM